MSASNSSQTNAESSPERSIWDEAPVSLRLPGGYALTPPGVVAHAAQVAKSRMQSLLEDGQLRELNEQQMLPLSELYDELCHLERKVSSPSGLEGLDTQRELALAVNVTDLQSYKSLQTIGVIDHTKDILRITRRWDESAESLMARYDALENSNGVGHGLQLGHRMVAAALASPNVTQETRDNATSGKLDCDESHLLLVVAEGKH